MLERPDAVKTFCSLHERNPQPRFIEIEFLEVVVVGLVLRVPGFGQRLFEGFELDEAHQSWITPMFAPGTRLSAVSAEMLAHLLTFELM